MDKASLLLPRGPVTTTELRFDVGERGSTEREIIYGRDAYAIVRKNNQNLPDELFGHAAEAHALPLIRWEGGRGIIRLYGLGEAGRLLLLSNFSALADTLRAVYGHTIRMQLLEHETGLGLVEKGGVRSYIVHSMVVGTQDNQKAFYDKATSEERIEFITKKIRSGIEAQAARMGLLGANGAGAPSYIIKKVEAPQLDPIRAKSISSNTRWAFVVPKVTFISNLQLDGPWAVGGLTSKGYGRLKRNLPYTRRDELIIAPLHEQGDAHVSA